MQNDECRMTNDNTMKTTFPSTLLRLAMLSLLIPHASFHIPPLAAQEPAAPELFTTPATVKPPPAEIIAAQLKADLKAELQRRIKVHRDAYDLLWKRQDATPAEILAALGPSATFLFQLSAENKRHLEALAKLVGKTLTDFLPIEYQTPPVELLFHQDGTVTLKE